MRFLQIATAAALLLEGTGASFDGNLNYDTPSRRHARLGINVPQVERRSMKRGNVEIPADELSYTHGIASGDPWPESVILWTRIAPSNISEDSTAPVDGTAPLYSHETKQFTDADPNPVCVEWKVFEEPKDHGPDGPKPKCKVAASGKAYTTSDIDYTVKVEAKGLKPLTSYKYQFTVCGSNNKSPMGKTKTAPREDDAVSELSFTVFSCSNYPNGYFNAYGNAARKAAHDYVIHLGDYLYEYGEPDSERPSVPEHEIFTLHDYRSRHGLYRSDPDLQLLAKDYPWITTWDDHEFANNGYRDGFSGLNNTEESFRNDGPEVTVDTRKVHAVRAYFEWMPIRQTDMDDGLRVWRSFKMGKLLDLMILDTRNYDRSITSLGWNNDYIDTIRDDPSRTMMGSRQENWFYQSMSDSMDRGATWRLVGNQLIISRVFQDESGAMSADNWNGYIANRNRTLKHLYDNGINNNIFLAGDSHQNWVSDLAWLGTEDYDMETGEGAIGVEFAGTAVSSGGLSAPIEPSAGDYSRGMIERNEEMMWQEGYYRGYFHLTVTPEKLEAQFFGCPTVATRNGWDIPLANFTVLPGENHLHRPIGGGKAESGALRFGEIDHTNLTLNTETGEWDIVGFEEMFL